MAALTRSPPCLPADRKADLSGGSLKPGASYGNLFSAHQEPGQLDGLFVFLHEAVIDRSASPGCIYSGTVKSGADNSEAQRKREAL
jgi:hypothetical protein